MKYILNNELMLIAHRLSRDALLLYVLGGFGFLVAEMILPGIFSQRINFFFLYAGLFGLMGLVIALGYRIQQGVSKEEKSEKKEKNVFSLVLQIVFLSLFFVLIIKNMNVVALPFFAILSSMGIVYLSRNLLK